MESPELSPVPREFPEVPKQLKVLATERLRYFGILSLKSLSRIAAAAVLNLGCSASGLPAGPMFQPVLSLMKISRTALVSSGVPKLKILAKVQAAVILKTGCDVSQKLPNGPLFTLGHPVTPPVTPPKRSTRKRKTTSDGSPEPISNLCLFLGNCKLDPKSRTPAPKKGPNLPQLVENVDMSFKK